MFRGIDISEFQSSVDFEALKAGGIRFVMIRTGYGRNASQEDKMLRRHVAGAEAAGLPYGFYHYSYATTAAKAREEAEFALRLAAEFNPTLPFAYDIEDASQKSLSKSALSEIADTFLTRIRDAGYYPMLYASMSWLATRFTDELLAKYDVWLAQWAAAPTWTGEYGMWQYTSSGRIAGISGTVDMNIAYRDYPALIAAMRGGAPSDGAGGTAEPSPEALTPPAPPDTGTAAPDSPAPPPASTAALDNTPDAYAASAIARATERGILRGDERGDLMLHSPLTRQDLFVILDRLALLG